MAQMLMTSWSQGFDGEDEEEPNPQGPGAGESLTHLLEALAKNTPAIDARAQEQLSAAIAGVIKKSPDRVHEAEKIKLVQTVVHELEHYRNATENALREQLDGWRGLVKNLVHEVAVNGATDAEQAGFHRLTSDVATLSTSQDLKAYSELLHTVLHAPGSKKVAHKRSPVVDNSCATNDNAAGLRGGGAAVAHLQSVLDRCQAGFVAVIQLSCMNVIEERFGITAVEDCVMAVSAFLTDRLENDDAIYHWNDTTLLAIFEGRNNKGLLSKELEKIAAQNRDITININDRTVLIRVPLAFELSPVSGFHSGDDLYKFSPQPASNR
jgi:GGDEF domain-containing protein